MSTEAHPPELTGVEAAAAETMEIRLRVALNEPDSIVIMERVRGAMAARQAAGREHYGMTLAENQAPLRERIRHLWEEMLDGLAYSEWILDGYTQIQRQAGYVQMNNEDFSRAQSAGFAAFIARKRIIDALVEMDRVMRELGMDPVKKEGADE